MLGTMYLNSLTQVQPLNVIVGSHIQAFSQSSYKDHWVTMHVQPSASQ